MAALTTQHAKGRSRRRRRRGGLNPVCGLASYNVLIKWVTEIRAPLAAGAYYHPKLRHGDTSGQTDYALDARRMPALSQSLIRPFHRRKAAGRLPWRRAASARF